MSNLNICRICLDDNVRLHRIAGSDVQDVYEKLTNKMIEAGTAYYACYMCYRQLERCKQLVTKSQKAEELLKQISSNSIENNESVSIDRHANGLVCYTATTLECISIHENVELETPAKWDGKEAFRTEPEEKTTLECEKPRVKEDNDVSEPFEVFFDGHATDSEDDLPLKNISTRQTLDRSVKMKKLVLVRKLKDDLKVDAHEILLTKEQQLEKLLERSKSLNYISSPFKCELCYKGFLDARAYENHKRKHDAHSGQHECDVCRMRYKTARLLRTHAAAAHARLFRCNKCVHVSHTRNQAKEHEKWHSGHTYECQLCGQKFRKPTSYLTHKRTRHPTEHVCHICGETFVGRHGLSMHKSKSHKWDQQNEIKEEPTLEHFCSVCDVQFQTVRAWQRHLLTSVNHTLANQGTQCKICHERLSGESMAEHLKGHEKSLRPTSLDAKRLVKVACDQCDAHFVGTSNLRAHVRRVHLGLKYNRNVVCEVCGKKCTSNASLKYHQRTHTGERPFPCAECGKRFPDRNQLRIHTRTHTGERPYCCAACGKRFSQKPALNRHYRVHTGVKPYECQFCSKTFNQSNSMKVHVKTVHLKLPAYRKKAQNAPTEKSEAVE